MTSSALRFAGVRKVAKDPLGPWNRFSSPFDSAQGGATLFVMLERLQKILSARGIASRRKAEEYIEQGLVKVNGAVAHVGQKADPEHDTIEVDGKVLEDRQEMLYYVLNKPLGVLSSNVSREGGTAQPKRGQKGEAKSPSPERMFKTVRDILPKELRGKVFPVGRLDKDSSGLLLLTNDGVVAYRLTHPKFDHEKEYLVTLDRPITDEMLGRLKKGMIILGSETKPAKVQREGASMFTICLTEGKNRQIRRMCEKLGYRVRNLRRIRIVTLRDDSLQPGALRPLHKAEVEKLRSALDL